MVDVPEVNRPSDPPTPQETVNPPSEAGSPVASSVESTADRPHRFTLFASFGSVALSVVSLVVSVGSLYFTHLSMQVGQRAYLSFAPTFPVYRDEPNASSEDSLLLPAEIEIRNLGNTPAYNVTTTVAPQKPDSEYKISSDQPTIPAIGPKETAHVYVNVVGSRRSYRNGLTFPAAAPTMCTKAAYTDVFGIARSDGACFAPAFKITIEGYNPPRVTSGRSDPKK